MISALYVRRDSIYKTLGLDCWDIDRDARLFHGPGPIIAHPPCGHWGRYRSVCKQPGRDCGLTAIDQVRRFGGVLEHPASSQLFRYCACSASWAQTDTWGGRSLLIHQWDYGHQSLKATRLYIVGTDTLRGIPPPIVRSDTPRPLERLSHKQREATPDAVARMLIEIARRCHVLQN